MKNLQQNLYYHEEDDEVYTDVKDRSEDGNGDQAQNAEFRFSGKVVQLSDEEDDWSDSSSDDLGSDADKGTSRHMVEVYGTLGACYRDVDNNFKTFYRYVEPDRRASCNVMASGLKDPVSLLTKYRSQRLEGKSRYFHSAFSRHPELVRRRRQPSPLLKDCPGVEFITVRR
ncbi:hypothetical protein DHEL01_v211744 [Diaporthe helianthi]|uniref:Uncharacterized protein n=1 Tax=Diaporthe helianthi TaxID=158607 RepID=A0A2P5HHY0_DIAHE|nr:hypothetical protein DHEL01_v211744 [Diaporthe helianthi]